MGTGWTDPGGPCQQTLSILVSSLQLNQRGRLWSAAKVLSHTATLNSSFQNLISFWNTLVLVNERRKSLLFLAFTFFHDLFILIQSSQLLYLISTLELKSLGSSHNQWRSKAPFKRCRPLPVIAVGVHNINTPEPFTRHTSFPLTWHLLSDKPAAQHSSSGGLQRRLWRQGTCQGSTRIGKHK